MRNVLSAVTLFGLCLTMAQADEGFYTRVCWPNGALHEGMVECWQTEPDGLSPRLYADCWYTPVTGPLRWWANAPDSLKIPYGHYYTYLAWYYTGEDTMFSDYPDWQWYAADSPGPWSYDLQLQYNSTRPCVPERP